MDVKTIQAIESILKRGNDANVRRKAVGTWSSRSRKQLNQAPRRLCWSAPTCADSTKKTLVGKNKDLGLV